MNDNLYRGRMALRSNLLGSILGIVVLALSFGGVRPLYGAIQAGPITNAANQHVYLLLTHSSWTEAEAEAVSLGGHLVTIRSKEENDWIYSSFAYAGGTPHHMWIGLYRTSWASGYQWVSGEPVSYSYWAPGEPNNCDGIEDHGIMFGPEYAQYGVATFWNDVSESGMGGGGGGDLAPCGIVELDGPPSIVSQPRDCTVGASSNATFTVVASGALLSYQWRFDGKDIPGATSSSLVVTNVQPSSSPGSYSVLITNGFGSVTSSNATLKVKVVFGYANNVLLTTNLISFNGSATINLRNSYANGALFYTLDGSTPDFTSKPYTNTFVLSQTAMLRAIGYRDDFLESGELDPVTISVVPVYTLSASTPGGGRISLSPSGGTYVSNTVVSITATPTDGWVFLQWLGDLAGTKSNQVTVMNRNQRIQAVFATTLKTTAAGAGVVAMDPASDFYPYGTVVALTATAQAGNFFATWGNAASGNQNPLYYSVTNGNRTVSSLFHPLGSNQVALTVVPNGFGQVTVSPQASVFTVNASAKITATPRVGQCFVGWSGDATGTQNPLNISMNQSKVITATFTRIPSLTATSFVDGAIDGGLRITLNGEYSKQYQILFSTDLADWQPVATVATPYGQAQYFDAPFRAVCGFYRAIQVP